MTQRVAIVTAAGIAAFVVVLLGALATYVVLRGPQPASAFAAQAPASTQAQAQAQAPSGGQVPPAPVFGGQDGSQSSQSNQQGGSGAANNYPVSADDAATIALNNTPGASLVQQPRLVNVNGTIAYEVPLDRGNVYVDARSGQVLYNAANGEQGQFGRRHRRGDRQVP